MNPCTNTASSSLYAQHQNHQSLSVLLQNGDPIFLINNAFLGSVPDAMNYLQEFCHTHNVRLESLGWGNSMLFVKENSFAISPYGISLTAMLRMCGEKTPEDFPVAAARQS